MNHLVFFCETQTKNLQIRCSSRELDHLNLGTVIEKRIIECKIDCTNYSLEIVLFIWSLLLIK